MDNDLDFDPDIEGDDDGGDEGHDSSKARNDSDDISIPKWRFDQVNSELRGLKDEMAEIRNSATKTSTAPEKVWSSQELDQFVFDGKITQSQASDILARQAAASATKEAREAITAEFQTARQRDSIGEEISQYVEKIPSLNDPSSPEFQRVSKEFEYVTGRFGMARDDPAAQLAAVRGVFGPVSSVTVKPSKRKVETPQEQGGGGESDDDAGGSKMAWKDLTADERSYYQRQIDDGLYADRKEVLGLVGWKHHGRGGRPRK